MKPVSPKAAANAEELVRPPSETHGEPLNAARERARVAGLDDHVDVIVLHGKVNDAKNVAKTRRPIRIADAPSQLAKQDGLAHRRQPFANAHRHMRRLCGAMPLAPSMLHPSAPGQTRTPRPVTPAAPLVEFDLELLHLN